MIRPFLLNKTVLVVDDEPSIRCAIRSLFESCGSSVLEAGSGNAALEVTSCVQVDLIVSDVRMPDGSGEDLLEKVGSMSCPPPVILMSGHCSLTPESAIQKGADAFLEKPVSFNKLLATCQNVLQKRGKSTGSL